VRSDQAHSYGEKHKPGSCCGESEQRSLLIAELVIANPDFIPSLEVEYIFLMLLEIAKRSFQSVCVHFEQSAKLKIFSLASTTANLADLNALPYTKLMPLFCTCSCLF
jgi:hypothetical protein